MSKKQPSGPDSHNHEVYVADHAGGGINYYVVMVDGKPYNDFFSTKRLTWTEQWDVAQGYKEALDRYVDPMVE